MTWHPVTDRDELTKHEAAALLDMLRVLEKHFMLDERQTALAQRLSAKLRRMA